MAEREQGHRGVAVPVSVGLRGFDQLTDFVLGEVFAAAKFGIRPAPRQRPTSHRSENRSDGWRDQLQMRNCHGFPRL